MRNIQEVKCSNESVERFPRGLVGISAADNFSGLLTVMSHFHNPQAYFIATGFSDSAAVTVLLHCFTSGNVLSFCLYQLSERTPYYTKSVTQVLKKSEKAVVN